MADALTKLGEAARRARAYISPWNVFSPTDVASFAPGGGIVDAAKPYGEGLKKTAEATRAFREGRYGDAARFYGSGMIDTATAGLSAAGEVAPFAKLAMAMVPAFRNADDVADAASGGMRKLEGIRAFHGSPHDFDRFDMSKIGTGEGAQAYGHGLYFAEAEDVAKGYRNALAPGMGDGALRAAGIGDADLRSLRQFTQSAVDPDVAMRDWLAWTGKKETPELRQAFMQEWQGRNPGRMYEVRINADPEHFLDWDKPLAQQSEAVQQTLQQRFPQYFEERMLNPFTRMPVEFKPGQDQAKLRDFYVNQQGYPVERAADTMTAKTLAERHNFDPPSMSRELNEAGIPGIKYLDAGSRGAGDGTRNYVVFDDKLVEIIRKYGWAPGMAIPAAMALEMQQAQEQSAPQSVSM